jgi:hypothetical protein
MDVPAKESAVKELLEGVAVVAIALYRFLVLAQGVDVTAAAHPARSASTQSVPVISAGNTRGFTGPGSDQPA